MRPTTGQPTTGQTTGQTPAQRVTVPEAAAILGLSEDAVRSRLKRGTLRREKAKDGTVLVLLGADRPTTNSDQPSTDQTTGQADLLEVLRDQVGFLQEQLAEEREANRENRRIIAGLVQRVSELEAAPEAPRSARGSSETDTERPEKGATYLGSQEPSRRGSWLYRFFFGP